MHPLDPQLVRTKYRFLRQPATKLEDVRAIHLLDRVVVEQRLFDMRGHAWEQRSEQHGWEEARWTQSTKMKTSEYLKCNRTTMR